MMRKTILLVPLAALCLGLLSAPAAALADRPDSTGVRETDAWGGGDTLTSSELNEMALEEETYVPASDDVTPPYYYLYTPTHLQQRSYWCGPATVQIIDDFLGDYVSQQAYADYMGTTTDGTIFSRIDDALRHYTGKPYYYQGPLPNSTELYNRIAWTIGDRHRPLVALIHINEETWPRYVFHHSGHIVPVEAFDYRTNIIRLNDPYNEAYWRAGGGDTDGHKTYGRWVLWSGVYAHTAKAIVR